MTGIAKNKNQHHLPDVFVGKGFVWICMCIGRVPDLHKLFSVHAKPSVHVGNCACEKEDMHITTNNMIQHKKLY